MKKGAEKAGKLRRRSVLILRRVLIFAIGTIALMALLSVHVQEGSKLPADATHKISTQHEIEHQKVSSERSFVYEFGSSNVSKALPVVHKICSWMVQKGSQIWICGSHFRTEAMFPALNQIQCTNILQKLRVTCWYMQMVALIR